MPLTQLLHYPALAAAKALQYRLNHLDLQSSQTAVFKRLLTLSLGSQFAKDHHLHRHMNLGDYQNAVPLTSYETLAERYITPHVQQLTGQLSTEPTRYLARTSGSSSGQEKLLPLTDAFFSDTRRAATAQAQFNFLQTSSVATLVDPMLWLTDLSPLFQVGNYEVAMLSRLVRETMPAWLNKRIVPSVAFLNQAPAENRFDQVVQAALNTPNIAYISGITPWLITLFETILQRSGAPHLKALWPHLAVISHAGVQFAPHAPRIQALAGPGVQFMECYVASEGFMGFQELNSPYLRLLPDHGLLYEFVRLSEYGQSGAQRHWLWELEPDVEYVIYISNACGIWGLEIGDTVRFVQTHPIPLFQVTGRVQQKFDVFGDKLLLSEIQKALQQACEPQQAHLVHFLVSPDMSNRSLHLLVEFEHPPAELERFVEQADQALQGLNTQYARNRRSGVNGPLSARLLKRGAFNAWLKAQTDVLCQTKLPFLCVSEAEQLRFAQYFQEHHWWDTIISRP